MTRRHAGVALLATLLVVALATLLIAGLLDRGMIGQARSLQLARSAQAHAFQQGLELWAGRILRDDRERDPVDSRTDAWAQAMPPIVLPEGMINGRLRDLDGCLDLNALASVPAAAERFRRLLDLLELDARLLDAVIDWTDADGSAGSSGGEDALYATLDPPRRAANRPFAHVSELRAVAGVDARTYERLAPHVCARPAPTPVNVNTATAEVLMSLGIEPALARRLHSDGRARFSSIGGDAGSLERALHDAGVAGIDLSELDVVSRHFVAEADLVIGEVPVRLYSLIERRDDGRIRVLARSQGRY
jgi:general secretion pathway protein K